MIDLLTLNIPAIIILGIVTSYTDLKYKKIRNLHCLIAFSYAIITLILYTLFLKYYGISIITGYYFQFILNIVMASVVGFIIWSVGLLPGGDIKLFITYASLIPIEIYKYGFVKYFPSITLLLNTFLPLFFILVIILLIKSSFKEKKQSLKVTFTWKNIWQMSLFVYGASWLVKPISIFPNDYFTQVTLLFLSVYLIEVFLNISFLKISIFLSIIRLIFDFQQFFSVNFYKDMIFLILSMLILRYLIIYISSLIFTKEIDISELKPGLIIADKISKHQGTLRRFDRRHYYDFFSYLRDFQRDGKGLFDRTITKEDIAFIKKSDKNFKSLNVHTTMPFAQYFFIGVIATLVAKGSILIQTVILYQKYF